MTHMLTTLGWARGGSGEEGRGREGEEGLLYLVSEYLDAAESSVYGVSGLTLQILISVYQHEEGNPLDPLLRGELCTQAVNP